MNYPAITIHQPWASWIAWGLKTMETRTHNRFASLKGQRIAIHAGKAWDDEAIFEAVAHASAKSLFQDYTCREDFPAGAIVCLATVDKIWTLCSADSQAALCRCDRSMTGLILADVEPLAEPFKVRGHQGIWRVELPE
jgi:hypothetical protein